MFKREPSPAQADWQSLNDALGQVEDEMGVRLEVLLEQRWEKEKGYRLQATVDIQFEVHRRELDYPPPITAPLDLDIGLTLEQKMVALVMAWYVSALEHITSSARVARRRRR